MTNDEKNDNTNSEQGKRKRNNMDKMVWWGWIESEGNENKLLYTVARDRKKWRRTVLEAKVHNRLHVVHEKKKKKLHFVIQ
jgi:hypothetical protein